jgi:hypothetical protein
VEKLSLATIGLTEAGLKHEAALIRLRKASSGSAVRTPCRQREEVTYSHRRSHVNSPALSRIVYQRRRPS